MPSSRLPFRPDIEGLRGIAILLVVLFHAGVPGFGGGFVGVDVFFVLSGFFITGPLVREVVGSGRIDLAEFYGRRAMRVLPVLLLVLLATLALVVLTYAPIDRANVAENAQAVAFAAGNIEFANESVNYFSNRDNPLLHTWSLGVEQQFYLLWPLLLLCFAWLGRRNTAAGAADVTVEPIDNARGYRTAKFLLGGIALTGAISLAVAFWQTSASQSWAFFGVHARLWEFALGGALAMLLGERQDITSDTPVAVTALQAAGLTAIAASVIAYSRATPYPGFAALLPAAGGALLLAAGASASTNAIGRVLASPGLQWFGRLSFAWYLWHWPLMSIGRAVHRDIGAPGKLAWAGIALGLAWLTHRFLEAPAREGKVLRIPREWTLTSAFAATVAMALLSTAMFSAANRTTARGAQRQFVAAREDRMRHDCWARTVDELPTARCEFGDPRSSTTIALLGDSHAEHWLGALDLAGKTRGWKIAAMVKGGCPVPDMRGIVGSGPARHFVECDRYREAMVQRIIAMRPTAVILSSWDHYVPVDGRPDGWQVSNEAWEQGLRRTYSRFSAAGIRVVAIRGTPRTGFDVPACLSRREARMLFSPSCEYYRVRAMNAGTIAAQTKAARGLGVRFVDMNDVICATASCPTVKHGVIVFTDDNHLTASFSRSVAAVFGARVQAAMSASVTGVMAVR